MHDKITETIPGQFTRRCTYRRYITKGKVVPKICHTHHDPLGKSISRLMAFIPFGTHNKKEVLTLIAHVIKKNFELSMSIWRAVCLHFYLYIESNTILFRIIQSSGPLYSSLLLLLEEDERLIRLRI